MSGTLLFVRENENSSQMYKGTGVEDTKHEQQADV